MNATGQAGTIKAVIEVVARALTDRPDEVTVMESEHKGTTLVELYVAPIDLGKVIGKQGRTAAALRTLAASAAERDGKTITLEIREGRPA
jgi:predicted RNA-binding protein YlqC (UPF0109 family)